MTSQKIARYRCILFILQTDSPTRGLADRERANRLRERSILMKNQPALAKADLELLKKYDTPTICNVVELYDHCPRTAFYMDARIRACFPKMPPMVGYASTATFRSAFPPTTGNVY